MSNVNDNQEATGGAETAKNDATQKTPENQNKTAKVQAVTGKAKNQKNSGKQKKGGKAAGLDTQGEKTATGTQGGDTGNQVSKIDTSFETGETVSQESDKVQEKYLKRVAERKRIAKEVFKKNANISTVYFTSDMLPFGSKSDAMKHAAKLANETITPINNEE